MRSSDSYFLSNRPYQDQEVLRALEKNNELLETGSRELPRVTDVLLESSIKNSEAMRDASRQLSEQIERQAEIDREEKESQHRESMFKLQEVAYGISNLEGTFRESINDLSEQVWKSGTDIVEKINITNNSLRTMNDNLLNINGSLQAIGGVLVNILEKIERPNEVQAIELADQARISIAIGEVDEALRVTTKAIELCSTSITANAYHLMTMSLFDEKELREKSRILFNKYVKLIGFKLSDINSEKQKESVHKEIYHTVYSTIFALSGSLGSRITNDVQDLFSHIARDKDFSSMFFAKPILDKATLKETLSPSEIRELTWDVILHQLINTGQYELLIQYIIKVTDSNILLKNELVALANKEIYKRKILLNLLNETWLEDNATEDELKCLNVFCSFQPQENIDLDDKTLLLLDRYVDKYSLPINDDLKKVL